MSTQTSPGDRGARQSVAVSVVGAVDGGEAVSAPATLDDLASGVAS